MDSAVVLRVDSCDQTTDSYSSEFINPAFRDIQQHEFNGTGESEVSFAQGIKDITLSLKNLLKMYEHHQVGVQSTSEEVAANDVTNQQVNQDDEEEEDYFSCLPVSLKFLQTSMNE